MLHLLGLFTYNWLCHCYCRGKLYVHITLYMGFASMVPLVNMITLYWDIHIITVWTCLLYPYSILRSSLIKEIHRWSIHLRRLPRSHQSFLIGLRNLKLQATKNWMLKLLKNLQNRLNLPLIPCQLQQSFHTINLTEIKFLYSPFVLHFITCCRGFLGFLLLNSCRT